MCDEPNRAGDERLTGDMDRLPRVPSFISRLLPSPVFHSGTLLLAWRLSPKSRKERGMLDLP